jgi:hypothetical protein
VERGACRAYRVSRVKGDFLLPNMASTPSSILSQYGIVILPRHDTLLFPDDLKAFAHQPFARMKPIMSIHAVALCCILLFRVLRSPA